MDEASYVAWDDNLYEWPPPDGWYEASDGKWWPDGYGPSGGEPTETVSSSEADETPGEEESSAAWPDDEDVAAVQPSGGTDASSPPPIDLSQTAVLPAGGFVSEATTPQERVEAEHQRPVYDDLPSIDDVFGGKDPFADDDEFAAGTAAEDTAGDEGAVAEEGSGSATGPLGEDLGLGNDEFGELVTDLGEGLGTDAASGPVGGPDEADELTLATPIAGDAVQDDEAEGDPIEGDTGQSELTGDDLLRATSSDGEPTDDSSVDDGPVDDSPAGRDDPTGDPFPGNPSGEGGLAGVGLVADEPLAGELVENASHDRGPADRGLAANGSLDGDEVDGELLDGDPFEAEPIGEASANSGLADDDLPDDDLADGGGDRTLIEDPFDRPTERLEVSGLHFGELTAPVPSGLVAESPPSSSVPDNPAAMETVPVPPGIDPTLITASDRVEGGVSEIPEIRHEGAFGASGDYSLVGDDYEQQATGRAEPGNSWLLIIAAAVMLVAVAGIAAYLLLRSGDAGAESAGEVSLEQSGPGSFTSPYEFGTGVVVFYPDADSGEEHRWIIMVLDPAVDGTERLVSDVGATAPDVDEVLAVSRVRVTYESGPGPGDVADLRFNAVGSSLVTLSQGENGCTPTEPLDLSAIVEETETIEGELCWTIPAGDLAELKLAMQAGPVDGTVHMALR